MDGRQAAATLGVDPRATRDEIRRAFRARVKRAHPDAGPAGSDEAFIELRGAFEYLLAQAPEPVVAREPVVDAEPEPFRPVAPAMASPWFAGVERPTVVDLVDSGPWTVRRSAPRPVDPVRRDRRGLSFDDHLAAALAAH